MKKGSITIHKYFRKIKNAIDALISNGQNVIEGEFIFLILDGIGLEFDPVVVHITSKIVKGFVTITLVMLKSSCKGINKKC